MKTEITQDQIATYQEQGFLIIEEFLNASELEIWRETVDETVLDRVDPTTLSQSSGAEETFYQNVFVQSSNLWKTNEKMRKLVLDPSLGKMTAQLAGIDRQRLYHDHAMIKRPWSNPTNWHMDNPFDPFFHRDALSIWLALDSVTLANGCLYYLPGVHKKGDYSFSEALLSVPNMGTLFKVFPEWGRIDPVPVEISAGSLAIHNGLTSHAAGPNMTCGLRRAFSVRYMPDGATYNGHGTGALDESYLKQITVGDVIQDDQNHPLVYPM